MSATGDTRTVNNELSAEWLQSRPGEYFLIRISSVGNKWLLLRYGNPLKSW